MEGARQREIPFQSVVVRSFRPCFPPLSYYDSTFIYIEYRRHFRKLTNGITEPLYFWICAHFNFSLRKILF
jgi:hypothetical protein